MRLAAWDSGAVAGVEEAMVPGDGMAEAERML